MKHFWYLFVLFCFASLLRCRLATIMVICDGRTSKLFPLVMDTKATFSFSAFWLKLWKFIEPLCFDSLFPWPLGSQTINGTTDPAQSPWWRRVLSVLTRPELGFLSFFGLVFTLKFLQIFHLRSLMLWCVHATPLLWIKGVQTQDRKPGWIMALQNWFWTPLLDKEHLP